jgi:hypothetical protein
MKLIKKDHIFYLYVDKSWAIASTDSRDNRDKKLSKQNCDSLFGVVDVEMVSAFYGSKAKGNVDFKLGSAQGFEDGFNDAMELNKDKLFTEDDLRLAMHFGTFGEANGQTTTIGFIQSLQQPTEIEVEIEEFEYIDGKNTAVDYMLDSEGCLILKRVV